MANKQTVWVQASEWLSKTLAVVLLMLLPGFAGGWLDKWLGTSVLMPIGFVLGVIVGTIGLVIIAKQLSVPVRGRAASSDANEEDPNDDATR